MPQPDRPRPGALPRAARPRGAGGLAVLGGIAARAIDEALAVLLPVACAGCGADGDAVCPRCRSALVPRPVAVESAGVPAFAALEYGGVVRAVLAAGKEAGRTDALRELGPALGAAVAAAVRDAGPAAAGAELAAVPSTPDAVAARGYRHVERMLAAAGLRASPALGTARARADQAGLDLAARDANLVGALRATGDLRGRRFVVVDDVVTTGATAREAVRALRAGGGAVVGAAFAAWTPRRHPGFTVNTEQDARDNTGARG